jgi:diacylglycerol kinase family enzyme
MEISGPQALLIGNNPYGTGDIAGLGRRIRLDRGELGVVAVTVASAGEAVGLINGRRAAGLRALTAREVTVTADTEQVPVGIDGESVFLAAPVRCAIRHRALRVWVPRDRPGVPAPKPKVNWARIWRLAAGGGQPRAATATVASHARPRVLR